MWALLLFFPSFLFAGLVPHVPGACTTRPTRQVWSPLRDLPWPEEPTFWGAWFNAFRSWCRPYYACWILHQQPQRDMEPSLWKLKGPDQTFSNWVRGDYEARKPVFSHLFFMCPPNQCSPSLFVTSELKFMIFSICSCELTWLFSCLGMTVAFTCWNTLQSGKVDGFLSSQLQWSSSSAKFTHGTGWWMKISTRGPTHVSS